MGAEAYEWWDLDGNPLFGDCYGILSPIELGSKDYVDWNTFAREQPLGAYAWLVRERERALDASVVALRLLQKMVRANASLPIASEVGSINRYEWIRLTVDSFLFRFASIRDQALHLVNEVLQLGLPDRSVTLREILKRTGPDVPFADSLRAVASTGQRPRHERNARGHQGVQRYLEDDLLFKTLAMAEQASPKRGEIRIGVHGKPIETFEVSAEASRRSEEILDELALEWIPICRKLVENLKTLIDDLYPSFAARCQQIEMQTAGN